METIKKSEKLNGVCYDIRGPVLEHAYRLEEEGHRILKLNIGNPATFGFSAPDEIIQDVIYNLPNAEGYVASRGLFAARKAIMQECQRLRVPDVEIDDIFLGNGVSELIVMSMQALLNNNDEMLIPAPDYPLWTAAVNLAGGKAVHYLCDEQSDWFPDIEDIKQKITDKTRGIVLINPNNPTGAVYSQEVLEQLVRLAEEKGLIIFADEIYSKILYDDAEFVPLGRLVHDTLCISFNGLSKSYRLAGFRSGWMVISGAKHKAKEYVQGIEMLASMRLCANVPAMYAVQTALGGYQSVNELIMPGGRLRDQRDAAMAALAELPGVSCVKPKGAMYLFPKIDLNRHKIMDDQQMVLDFLIQEKILLVQGTAFNWPNRDHMRIVFLPREDELTRAIDRLGHFLERYTQ
ncbi:pyridoxal phosphate-dependent aminotransferase [Gilvimarinus agarilyticus]|uniref:pyridoxal phosphate-dependent aminotransferase n=1 Tax=unclassified Gilvimarinus TaxID=2642066 RepID=UPI001C0A6463|nr:MULTISPECIES: pyridoxal phosphate-dependent aminotransferase [unclassified Gilvimarinus]MBU2886814.1 pyridoxal phosphate-dependent aminotransferase [Gilvimarinus agarilyticus]MDO6571478.1 pyridoxal phosphate-dependent aminotransferase [Gilvimarinus sp. 2_MG-2023]MDO6747341.1 pyridoxal phosphate-dependent aminotransferase [Gilvimarinus sp. 1_MG-2023]